jgi:hypothetical protein
MLRIMWTSTGKGEGNEERLLVESDYNLASGVLYYIRGDRKVFRQIYKTKKPERDCVFAVSDEGS